jgi:hypothetical protein
MVFTLIFLSSKCSLFHNSNVFGSCISHILYTGVLKLKKNNSGAKRLNVRKYVFYIAQCVVALMPPLVAFIRDQTCWVIQAV